ncbi:unnamed protein product, partial [Polarella glacialis]
MAPRKNSKKAEEAEVAEDQAMEVEEQEEQPEGEEAAAEEAEDMQEEGAAEEGEEEEAEADAEEETAGQLAPAEEEAEEPSTEQVVETEAAASAIAEKEVAKPRLMIREIVLENFKSYGGRKIIGPFHKSFSSIVGPNGSGKSNTIDALLFVFGKRAKKMRLNKVSELIHQSGAMPNLASAKVEVTFQDIRDTGDGPEDYEILEGTTLTVSREAFKNNSSKYYLDGKLSNFGDVTTLLKTRGVDLEHNRFLILQGEVEQISLMKPKASWPRLLGVKVPERPLLLATDTGGTLGAADALGDLGVPFRYLFASEADLPTLNLLMNQHPSCVPESVFGGTVGRDRGGLCRVTGKWQAVPKVQLDLYIACSGTHSANPDRFFAAVKYIAEYLPKAVILEDLMAACRPDHAGNLAADAIIALLEQAGPYEVDAFMVNTADYGLPQRRTHWVDCVKVWRNYGEDYPQPHLKLNIFCSTAKAASESAPSRAPATMASENLSLLQGLMAMSPNMASLHQRFRRQLGLSLEDNSYFESAGARLVQCLRSVREADLCQIHWLKARKEGREVRFVSTTQDVHRAQVSFTGEIPPLTAHTRLWSYRLQRCLGGREMMALQGFALSKWSFESVSESSLCRVASNAMAVNGIAALLAALLSGSDFGAPGERDLDSEAQQMRERRRTQLSDLRQHELLSDWRRKYAALRRRLDGMRYRSAFGALTPHEDGLLEYLEDIIGSNRFLEPIEQSEAVVEKLTEQRQEKLNRLRVAEREKESLDGPRKEAEAWVTAEAERLELQSLLAQAEAKKSQANLAGLEEEHKALQTHMEGHRLKMEGFEKEVKAIEGEHNTHLSDYNKIKEKMEKSALDFKEFERLDVKFTEDIAFHEQKLQKLSQTAQREREQAVQLVKDAEQLKVDAPTREQELDSAERFRTSQATKLEQLFAGLKGKAERLRPAKEAKEKELVPLQQKLTEVKKVVEVAQTEAGFLRQKTVEVADQIEQLKREHTECSQRLSVRELEGKDATKMRKDRVKLVGDAKQRLGQVTAQMEEVTQEAQATRVKAEEARSEFEQEHFRGRLIKAVYEQSKAGRLKGVYGRLGDLGTINKKYDVAVSTACSMLDAIVVETTEDAQAVIEFIRSQDLGRTTCICMQKIQEKARHMDSFDNAPESASRLLDLIKPEKPEYRVAFFFALGNTLVAKDMDQATRIGLQGKTRHRVVTLAGGLIDTSGTMSGGGGKVASGGMRASICRYSPEEVKGLVAAYEQANAKLVSIRQERQALDEALTLTEKEISDIELREQKCTMEVSALTKQMEAYDARLKVLKVPQLSGDEKSKLKQLEKLIESRSDELNTIMQEHQAVEEEVRKLHDQIMNIGGDELKQAKAKLEESTKKCEDMRRNIKKALLDADNMVKNSKKAEASAKVAVDEHKTCEKALETLRNEHAKLDDKAEQVLNAYNKLKDTLAEKDEVLTALRGKRDEVIQKASSLKSQEVDLVNEMEVKTRTLRELYGRITAWSNKLQEARKEYAQLPLDLLAELRGENKAQGFKWQELARKAMAADLELEVLEQVVRADIDARMLTLEANVKNLKPNLTSIEEFRRADGEHRTRLEDYETVHGQREDARRNLEQLRQSRLEEFMEAFSIISMKLKEMYQMITLGGDAELELVDTLDPFSEGIAFSVRPPKKSWKQITNLSGGEKTLASLSL